MCFLYKLPSFFHQHTLHASVLHTTLKRQRWRVTFTVSAKVNVCSSLILAPMTVRISHLTFLFLEQVLIFCSPVYTTQKCPPDHPRKTVAARDLDSQCQGRSSKFRHFSTLTVRSSHQTFVFLYQVPIFFLRRTLHTNAFHTTQERRQRRVVTLSVCAKVEFETCPNFRHCSTPTVQSSRLTFVFLYKLPSFFNQHTLYASVLHTTQERQRRRVTFTVSAKVKV